MRLLLTSALALLVLAGPAAAQGTSAPTAPPVAFSSGDFSDAISPVSAKLVNALSSTSATERADALHQIVTLAFAAEKTDLRPAIPALLSVFRTDAVENHRLLALRALEATADERVMTALRHEAGLEAERGPHPFVQRLLFSVLANHYGVENLRHDADMVSLAQTIRDGSR